MKQGQIQEPGPSKQTGHRPADPPAQQGRNEDEDAITPVDAPIERTQTAPTAPVPASSKDKQSACPSSPACPQPPEKEQPKWKSYYHFCASYIHKHFFWITICLLFHPGLLVDNWEHLEGLLFHAMLNLVVLILIPAGANRDIQKIGRLMENHGDSMSWFPREIVDNRHNYVVSVGLLPVSLLFFFFSPLFVLVLPGHTLFVIVWSIQMASQLRAVRKSYPPEEWASLLEPYGIVRHEYGLAMVFNELCNDLIATAAILLVGMSIILVHRLVTFGWRGRKSLIRRRRRQEERRKEKSRAQDGQPAQASAEP